MTHDRPDRSSSSLARLLETEVWLEAAIADGRARAAIGVQAAAAPLKVEPRAPGRRNARSSGLSQRTNGTTGTSPQCVAANPQCVAANRRPEGAGRRHGRRRTLAEANEGGRERRAVAINGAERAAPSYQLRRHRHHGPVRCTYESSPTRGGSPARLCARPHSSRKQVPVTNRTAPPAESAART